MAMRGEMNKAGRWKDIAIIAAITVALLAICELALRVLFPYKAIESRQPTELAYEFNEDYLVSLKPNLIKTFVRKRQNGGDVIQWRSNSDSFRGASLRPGPGRRIVVYGDSNIQARFSHLENTYVAKLEGYLRDQGLTDIEVLNAGILGFGPDQSLIRFSQDIDSYDMDLVVFHIFADNDFGDLLRNRLFELDSEGNLQRTAFRKMPDGILAGEDPEEGSLRSPILIFKIAAELKGHWQRSRMSAGQRRQKRLLQLEEIAAETYSMYKARVPRVLSIFDDEFDIDVALAPNRESSRAKTRLMEAILREAKYLAQAREIDLLVVIQPSVIDLTTDNADLGHEYLQEISSDYRRENLSDAVEKACIENNIEFVNLFDVFAENNPEDLYFKSDNHWTDAGQDLAARVSADHIIRNSMFTKN